MKEMDEFDILAEKNREKYALEGEVFAKNFILGLDYKSLDEARSAIEKEHVGMVSRFDQEHIVTDDGTILSTNEYVELKVLGRGVSQNMAGVAVYLKPKG